MRIGEFLDCRSTEECFLAAKQNTAMRSKIKNAASKTACGGPYKDLLLAYASR